MTKVYDEQYFERWYRGTDPAADRAHLKRKVAMAVAVAEYYLERPIQTVLDIGAGEAAWRAPLRAIRSDVDYLAFDSSEYAVSRYGSRRNLHYARFGDFEWLRPCPPVDLLICSDVMHYVSASELKRGIVGLAELTGGVAFLETFVKGDPFAGDQEGFVARSGRSFRSTLSKAGLEPIGSHFWVRADVADGFAAMERPF